MSAQANVAPVIIKRKKVVSGGGHHGGAWKVAYADFVTAMMAFFMLMWLLNATTEQQRKGIADYFSPTIPINRVSGGGNGAFGGETIFSEEVLPKNGTGGSDRHASEERALQQEALKLLDDNLRGLGGESAVMENALRHVVTRITDEGLVIELFELEGIPLFQEGGDQPTQLMQDLATLIAGVSKAVTNKIAVGGHVQSQPVVLAQNPVWELSAARATVVRELLQESGVKPGRIRRVTGHADRDPVAEDTMARRNNRMEIILLRDVKRN
jgi:chemotaxis protein MotB